MAQLDVALDQPDVALDQPDVAQAQPDVIVAQPDVTLAQPVVAVAQPDICYVIGVVCCWRCSTQPGIGPAGCIVGAAGCEIDNWAC